MRIAVYGSGGIGGYFGARLAAAGHDVVFIARGKHLEAINKRGLRIYSPAGDAHLTDLDATNDPTRIGPVDLVLVAVKTWQATQIVGLLPSLLHDKTMVLPLLNGVEASDEIAQSIGATPVLGGRATIFSAIESPGTIRHSSPMASIELGELGGNKSRRVTDLTATLVASGIDATQSDDIRLALWRKLILVSSWAGLATTARSPIGPLRSNTETRLLVDRSIDEGIAVAQAHGHEVETAFKTDLWRLYDSLPEDTTSSMQRDINESKPSELDAWNGAIVRFARQCNVPTPVHEIVYHLLLPNERLARA